MRASPHRSEKSETIRHVRARCSIGTILVATTDKGVCAILLGDSPQALERDLQARFPQATLRRGDTQRDEALQQLVSRVVSSIETPAGAWDLALDVRGTPFQRRVWRALQSIPPGTTASYTDIARRIGQPKAVRAVAQACGANAIAVAIPCHRVIRGDGTLSGYRWGTQRKRALLGREAAG